MDISKGKYWDKPWSLVSGCTPCSPGCRGCWSAGISHRFSGDFTYYSHANESRSGKETGWPTFNGKILTHPERLDIPLKRKKPTVFAVWNDLGHPDISSEFFADTWGIMDSCAQHIFLCLTKRPQRFVDELRGLEDYITEYIYWGLTICNQQEADEKIPVFLQVPGKKFLSIEPSLSNISLWETYLNVKWIEYFDVIIMGAETGGKARPMDLEWARTIRDECVVAGTPFFLKQVDKKHNRLLDGKEHNDLPWR